VLQGFCKPQKLLSLCANLLLFWETPLSVSFIQGEQSHSVAMQGGRNGFPSVHNSKVVCTYVWWALLHCWYSWVFPSVPPGLVCTYEHSVWVHVMGSCVHGDRRGRGWERRVREKRERGGEEGRGRRGEGDWIDSCPSKIVRSTHIWKVLVSDCVDVLHSKQTPYSVNFQLLEVNFSTRVPTVLEPWHPAIITPGIWNNRCFVSVWISVLASKRKATWYRTERSWVTFEVEDGQVLCRLVLVVWILVTRWL